MVANQDFFYENKIRTRVSGVIIKHNQVLLVKHRLQGAPFYAPPGGAVEFGETLEHALHREILEETNLKASSISFGFITEYVNPPLHAIEIFYIINNWQGSSKVGLDPESGKTNIIEDLVWLPIEIIKKKKKEEVHHIFHNCNNLRDILAYSGYIPSPTNYSK